VSDRNPWDVVPTTGEHLLEEERKRLEGWLVAGAVSFGLWVVLAALGFLARSLFS
jgi:hypothetical protein